MWTFWIFKDILNIHQYSKTLPSIPASCGILHHATQVRVAIPVPNQNLKYIMKLCVKDIVAKITDTSTKK